MSLKIVDYTGKTVRELPAKGDTGLHRVSWDLASGGGGPNRGRGQNPQRGRGQNAAPPGMYRVVLTVDGKEHTQGLRVENDPLLKSTNIIAEEDEDEEAREKRGGRIDDD